MGENKFTKALYDQLNTKLELGDYTQFETKLGDDAIFRKAIYDQGISDLDLGDYNSFESNTKKKASPLDLASQGQTVLQELGQPLNEPSTQPLPLTSVETPPIEQTQPKPKDRETTAVGDVLRSLKSGSLMALGGITGLPSFANRTITGFAVRPFVKGMGGTDQDANMALDNLLALQPGGDILLGGAQAQEKFNKIAAKTEAKMFPIEGGIAKNIAKGDLGQAGELLMRGVFQSAPYLAMTLATAGGGTAAVLGTIGATAASQQYASLEGKPEKKRILNSWLYGGFEAAGELVTAGIANGIGRAFKAGVIKEVNENFVKGAAKQVIKDFGLEGSSEVATQIGQNITDIITGVDPNRKVFDNWFDVMLIGGVSGAGLGGAHVAASVIGRSLASDKEVTQVQDNVIQQQVLIDQIETTDSDPIKSALESRLKNLRYESDAVMDANYELAKRLPKETKTKVAELYSVANDLQAKIDNKELSPEEIPTIEKTVEGIKNEIQTIKEDFIAKEEEEAKAEQEAKIDAIKEKKEVELDKLSEAKDNKIEKIKDVKEGEKVNKQELEAAKDAYDTKVEQVNEKYDNELAKNKEEFQDQKTQEDLAKGGAQTDVTPTQDIKGVVDESVSQIKQENATEVNPQSAFPEGFTPEVKIRTVKGSGVKQDRIEVKNDKGEVVSSFDLKTMVVDGETYWEGGSAQTREEVQGKGLAQNVLKLAMERLPEEYKGLYFPGNTIQNTTQIPRIFEKLGKIYDVTTNEKGDVFIKPKAKGEESKPLVGEEVTSVLDILNNDSEIITLKSNIEKLKKERTHDIITNGHRGIERWNDEIGAQESLLEQKRNTLKNRHALQIKSLLDNRELERRVTNGEITAEEAQKVINETGFDVPTSIKDKVIQNKKDKENDTTSILGRTTDFFGKAKDEWMIPLNDIGVRDKETSDYIKGHIKKALEKNKYQQAINDGRMTASDAKYIIESAGLKTPKDILNFIPKDAKYALTDYLNDWKENTLKVKDNLLKEIKEDYDMVLTKLRNLDLIKTDCL